ASLADGTTGAASNYVLSLADAPTASASIDPAPLTISTGDVTKTYDATTTADGTSIATAGTQLFGDDTLSGGHFAFVDVNAGSDKTVTVSNVSVNDGNDGNNYLIAYIDNTTSTIERAQLVITADDESATYDGRRYDGGFSASYAGFVADEDEAVLDGELVFGGAATRAIAPGRHEISVSGQTSRNYAITYESGVLQIEGNPKDERATAAQRTLQVMTNDMTATTLD